ncbi:NAD(P)-binding oxidoreductase [Streptomyces mirabilis]|uniref:NAD(P)-binding oxidoreductase n=1 Tax=Streptomyces mirabilis TaxID=68239 RepID=UPI003329D0E2
MAQLVVAASGYPGSLGLLVMAHARERGHKVTELHDLRNQEAVRAALARTDAVVLIPRRGNAWQDAHGAVVTLAEAADTLDTAPHLVLLSSFAVGHGPMHPLNRTDPSLLPGRVAAEHATRTGRLPYTIVRPVWFSEDPARSHALTLTQDPRTDGMISRADLAATLIAAVEQPAARGTTFGLYNEPGPPLTDWASDFAQLRPDDVGDDNRTTRKGLGSPSVSHPHPAR